MPNIVTEEEQELYETLQDLRDRTESVDDVFEGLSGYINGMRSAQSEVESLREALGVLLKLHDEEVYVKEIWDRAMEYARAVYDKEGE